MASSQCLENPPALNPAGGGGKVVDDFCGLKAYLVGSAESKAAVILVSDIFGFEAPNLRKIADEVALSGYLVVVPEFLHGDPFDPSNPNNRAMWLQAHSPQKAFEEANPIIASLKAKGVSSIGAAGYCWGAKVVVELAKFQEVRAAVLLHPSLLTVDDIKGQLFFECSSTDMLKFFYCKSSECLPFDMLCPISMLGAEIDKTSPPELLMEFEQVLSANSGIDDFVKIFPGVGHGWTVRYNNNDVAAVRSAEEAFQDIHWCNKYLK